MHRFPLYIPSKGRYAYLHTSKALTKMGVDHNIVVEPKEVALYKKAIKEKNLRATVLTLDMDYKKHYELCDKKGLTISTGSGPARNFIWDHAIASGAEWHWIMDDNIRQFFRLNNNLKVPIETDIFWKVMEEFALRYKNVAMAGPNYEFFAPRKQKMPPFVVNTRIYSCNLIRNDVPYRWRGRYNEDTILSLDMLKGGWCTILFNAFLQDKLDTQSVPGGNTDELYNGKSKKKGMRYSTTGTIDKSRMLVKTHPDVAKLAWRFGRIHHYVDYRKFKNQRLIYRDDYVLVKGTNEYGMKMVATGK